MASKHSFRRVLAHWRRPLLCVLICAALVASSLSTITGHSPQGLWSASQLAATVTEHGHGHDHNALEDLWTALHGHAHDVVDHDHSPIALPRPSDGGFAHGEKAALWRPLTQRIASGLTEPLERPPRV